MKPYADTDREGLQKSLPRIAVDGIPNHERAWYITSVLAALFYLDEWEWYEFQGSRGKLRRGKRRVVAQRKASEVRLTGAEQTSPWISDV